MYVYMYTVVLSLGGLEGDDLPHQLSIPVMCLYFVFIIEIG